MRWSNVLIVYFIIGAIHLISIATETSWLTQSTKPLLMPVLLLVYYKHPGLHFAIALALGFAWVGDVLLLFDGELFFLLGMLSFFFTHVFYIRSFIKAGSTFRNYLVHKVSFLLMVILFATLISLKILPQTGDLFYPMLIYSGILIALVAMAFARLGNTKVTSFYQVTLGAILFMVSDILIANSMFVIAFVADGVVIMLTYIVAQYLIVQGLVSHEGMQ